MKKFLRIGVDLDGVAFDFVKPFLKFMNQWKYPYGEYEITLDKWTTFCPSDCGLCTKEEEAQMFEDFNASAGYLHLPLLPGARKTLFRLSDNGHDIMYITARPRVVNYDTKISLTNTGLRVLANDLQCTIGHSDKNCPKHKICSDCGIHVMIDDRIEYLREIKKHSPTTKTILLDYYKHLTPLPTDPEFDPDFIAHSWPKIEQFIAQIADN